MLQSFLWKPSLPFLISEHRGKNPKGCACADDLLKLILSPTPSFSLVTVQWLRTDIPAYSYHPKCPTARMQYLSTYTSILPSATRHEVEIEKLKSDKYLQTAPISWHWLMVSHGAITSTPIILSVDGGWTDWSEGTCWGYQWFGYRRKTRACTNPEPVCGGSGCVGRGIEVTPCDPRWGEQKTHQWTSNRYNM